MRSRWGSLQVSRLPWLSSAPAQAASGLLPQASGCAHTKLAAPRLRQRARMSRQPKARTARRVGPGPHRRRPPPATSGGVAGVTGRRHPQRRPAIPAIPARPARPARPAEESPARCPPAGKPARARARARARSRHARTRARIRARTGGRRQRRGGECVRTFPARSGALRLAGEYSRPRRRRAAAARCTRRRGCCGRGRSVCARVRKRARALLRAALRGSNQRGCVRGGARG